MKRKIKDFIFVVDAFGPMPVWSLQDYCKGAKDSYMIYQVLDTPKKKFPEWLKRLCDVNKFTKKLNRDLIDVEATIDGVVTYEEKYQGEKSKHIIGLKIERINIHGFYPTAEDEK